MNYVSTKGMSREDWLRVRRSGIGSSDVAAILGLSRWRTPLEVWKEKTGLNGEEREDTEAMEMGRELEDVVARIYAKRTGFKIRRDNKIRWSQSCPFFLCNLDRVISPVSARGPGILEIKTSSWGYARTWEQEIPLEHFVQVQHQLHVTGWAWADVALLIDGRHLKRFAIDRDGDHISVQAEILAKFWTENVIRGVAPPARILDYERMITRPDAIAEATAEIIELITRLKSLKHSKNGFEEMIVDLENKIKTFIGDREILSTDGETLATWRSETRRTINSKMLREAKPDVWEAYSSEKRSRRFVIKETKEET